MKITKRQLKTIIEESIEDNLYVVIGNAGRGRQTMWPKSSQPGVYSKTEAENITKEQNKDSRMVDGSIHFHTKPLQKALEYVNAGQEAHIGLTDLLTDYESGGLETEEENYERGFYREVSDAGEVDVMFYSSDQVEEESELVNEQYIAMAHSKPSPMKSRASEDLLRIMGKTKKMDSQKIEETIDSIVGFLLKESTLYVKYGDFGYIGLEDDVKKDYSVGELVRDLIASGDTDFFNGPQGVDEEKLQKLQTAIDKGVQGGIERWDSDVFGTYYNVDIDRVLRLWSRGKNLNVEEVETLPSEREEYEDIDDGTNDFEEYYS